MVNTWSTMADAVANQIRVFWKNRKKCTFSKFFQNPQISFIIKSTSADQVLTKIFQIDPKLTFNVFHILNHGRISKIEKNI